MCYHEADVKGFPFTFEEAAMKIDSLELTLLFDYYGELLTKKQYTCFDLYYNQDLSLAEIADEAGISRQGVHDSLTRAEAALRDFESKIGCVSRAFKRREQLDRITALAADLLSSPDETTTRLAREILAAADRLKE